jgi:hypothetical protein
VGTADEEAKARLEIERAAMNRQAEAIKAAEDAKKAAEAADNQNEMVAVEPQTAGQGWPDTEVQTQPGTLSQVAGVLRGEAGDLALARRLLAERPPGTGVSANRAGVQTDGAKAKTSGVRVARPAFER